MTRDSPSSPSVWWESGVSSCVACDSSLRERLYCGVTDMSRLVQRDGGQRTAPTWDKINTAPVTPLQTVPCSATAAQRDPACVGGKLKSKFCMSCSLSESESDFPNGISGSGQYCSSAWWAAWRNSVTVLCLRCLVTSKLSLDMRSDRCDG